MKENEKQDYRILFVCLGNIVRSPLAESIFRDIAEKNGLGDQFQVDSAGTSRYHVGEAPDSRMRRVAAQRGLEYSGAARQFLPVDYDRFDLIIAMDEENKSDIEYLAPSHESKSKVHLLREFDPLGGPEASVPDPYYGGIDGFEAVYDIVERSCSSLFDAIQGGDLSPDNKAD